MKKIYSFFATVLALASVQTADAFKATFIVDNPKVVSIVGNVWDSEAGSYVEKSLFSSVEEVNVFEYTDYTSLYIRTAQGYAINSVEKDGAEQLGSYEIPTTSKFISLSTYGAEECIYDIKTIDLESSRTASAIITVDNPDLVALTTGGNTGGQVTLSADGTTTLKFNPATNEKQLTIASTDRNGSVYAVTVNGEKVSSTSAGFNIEMANGDKIDIKAAYPVENYNVKVVTPEGMADMFKSITYYDRTNYTTVTVDGDFAAGAPVSAGLQITVNLNTSDYVIDALYVNDAKVNGTSYNTVLRDDITIKVEGHAYANYDVDIDIDDPSRVNVYDNNPSYGGKRYDFVAGVNTVTFKETTYGNSIYVEPTSGNVIKLIKVVNGSSVQEISNPGTVSFSNGAKIYITTGPKVPDTKFILWVDPEAVSSIKEITFTKSYTYEQIDAIEPVAGVNVFNYCYADLPMQMNISINHPDPIPEDYRPWNPYLSLNEGNAYTSTNYYMATYGGLKDGDMMRIFYDEPEKAEVSVSLSDGMSADDINVSVDTRAMDSWESMSLFVKSGVTISSAVAAKCTLDGEELKADAAGNFSFTVTGNHSVALDVNTSAIEEISGDDEAVKVVYNLQGIRMADPENLPAGIYVINGKKVLVK